MGYSIEVPGFRGWPHIRIVRAAISLLLLTSCGVLIPPIPQPPDRSDQVRVPWVLTGGLGDRLELSVIVKGADCHRFQGVDVLESEESVEVRAWVEELDAAACFTVLAFEPVIADLTALLGTRNLTGCMIEASGAAYSTRESCAELVDL